MGIHRDENLVKIFNSVAPWYLLVLVPGPQWTLSSEILRSLV